MTSDPATDERFLRRAIRLAMNGRGRVEPNPMVGCVLVKDGRVIGEGYHQQFGGPHAEPTALAACTESPAGATAYVTLEPCCHTDKKTPPCAPRLIHERVARVVVGCLDPNPAVNGGGVRTLRDAGVQVDGPVLEAECKQLIAAFLLGVGQFRPYYTLKWAETADGKVAGPGGRRMQISGAESQRLVHQLRARSNAVVVGINTVLSDDPLLTPRGVPPGRTPVRFILDRHLRTPEGSQLVRTADRGRVVIACGIDALGTPKQARLEAAGVTFWPAPDLWRLHAGMLAFGVTHAVVDAGPTLARAFIEQGLADRAWVFRSPRRVAGADAPDAVAVPGHFVPTATLDAGDDRLTESLNTRGPAFFAPVPSADLILAGSDLPLAG